MEINLTKINLTNSIANNVVDYVQQFEKKHMEVELNTEDPIYVLGNEEKINRIIQNLMKNALNYSDGDVVIDIFIKDESIILSFKNPISVSSCFAYDSRIITTTAVNIPSIIASGTCVIAKIPRNFTTDAPTPPTCDG